MKLNCMVHAHVYMNNTHVYTTCMHKYLKHCAVYEHIWHGQCTIINIQVMWQQYSCTVYFTYVGPVQQLLFNINQSESENVIFLPQNPSIDEDCSFCLFLAAQEGWSSWLSGRVAMLAPPPGWWTIDQNAGTCRNYTDNVCIMYVGMYWYVHHACNNK